MALESREEDVIRPPVRVGIVGLGRAALFDHLPALRALSGLFKIVAICDVLKERRDIVEKDVPGLRTYRQIEDMLDDPEIELVDIALPSVDHAKTALAALKRDKWTVVETPLALNYDDATVLKATAIKANNKLHVYTPGLFSPEFRLAFTALDDPRLGGVYDIRIRHQDYIRRDDWQSVKRCGGGAAWYWGSDAVLQAMALLRQPPAQLWSELKRVVSVGDAEDFAHIVLKSRGPTTADIELNSGQLAPCEPIFTIRGPRGAFTVAAGATEGTFHVVDPAYKFGRRRSSVRTPDLADMHEDFVVRDIPFALPEVPASAGETFWRTLYATIRTAAPFPVALDDVLESIRYLQLAKNASTFAH